MKTKVVIEKCYGDSGFNAYVHGEFVASGDTEAEAREAALLVAKCKSQYGMTEQQFAVLVSSVYQVWQQIAADVEEGCAVMGETMSDAARIETCLDADRLLTMANDESSNKLVYSLTSKQLQALRRRLVREATL